MNYHDATLSQLLAIVSAAEQIAEMPDSKGAREGLREALAKAPGTIAYQRAIDERIRRENETRV